MKTIRITSVYFKNFKALKAYSVSLQKLNILVGPNNCGKSTVIGAFRILDSALRIARVKMPDVLQGELIGKFGYHISKSIIPVSLENVHYDYMDESSEILFRLSNGNNLRLYFPSEGECFLVPELEGRRISSPARFQKEFPLIIRVIPVLGPVEHEETLLSKETVRSSLATHRASRHFRNYWHHYPEEFESFRQYLENSWPGMSIDMPTCEYTNDPITLSMFCKEGRYLRELYWAGFGFQIWCQLLTHITRSQSSSLLVVDEPEIYLHPNLQHQLLAILRDAGPDILLATHSSEIISDADASEIVVVDKNRSSGQRLRDVDGVQDALGALGSIHNIVLTQFANSKKILFVESLSDYKLIVLFAKRLGFDRLSDSTCLSVIPTEGFGAIKKVKSLSWVLKKAFKGRFKLACVFDRDYMANEELSQIEMEMKNDVDFVFIHKCKEIENYLLNVNVLVKALSGAIYERDKCLNVDISGSIINLLSEITSELKDEVQKHYIAKRVDFFIKRKHDVVTITGEAQSYVNDRWNDLGARLEIVPGKIVLNRLRNSISSKYGITLTDNRIVRSFSRETASEDLMFLLSSLDDYAVKM